MNLLACIAERWRARHLRCRGRVIVRGRLRVHGSGDVLVEDGTRFDAGPVGIELQPGGLSRIHIGPDCVVADGVTIEARQLVQLGRRVIVGRGARILDNHFHPLCGNRHHYPASRPVIIEDDVVIGADAIILAGVRVGAGARVAAAAVVTHPVAAGAAVAGNPARRVSAS